MNKIRTFQYALLGLILGPLAVMTVYGAGKAIAQAVNSSAQVNIGATKVTVNSPPNDVVQGPQNVNGTGSVAVSAQGSGSTGIDIRGSGSGMTYVFEGSVDGTNYVTIPCVVPLSGAIVTGGTANGTWTCQSAGYQLVRVRFTAFSSGTASVTLNASAGSNQPPIGTQGTATNITAVGGNAVTTTIPVSGTFTPSGNQTVVQPTAANLNATVVGTGTFATQSVVTQPTAANLNATVVGTGTLAVQVTSAPSTAVTNAGTFATQTTGATNVTLTDCSGTIATGNTAQNAFAANGGRHGFTIANIDTTEVMWISFTGTAAASGTASYPLAPATATTFAGLNSFTSPLGMGINTALSVIAATTAHKFSCTVW
jgi:hypothetical protein